jgi:hypothetical protein
MASAVLAEYLDEFMLRALAAGRKKNYFSLVSTVGRKTLYVLKYGD